MLELRLDRARTTKDVDLRVTGSPDKLLVNLQQAGRQDLGDFMTFEVNPDAEHPTIENDGMQYEGQRFRAECRLAGKLYGQRFGVDVAPLAIRSLESPTLSPRMMYSTSLASRRPSCGCIRSKPTSRKSCMPTRCLVSIRTLA